MNKYIWMFFVIGFVLQVYSSYEEGNTFRMCLGISGSLLGIVAIVLDLCGVK